MKQLEEIVRSRIPAMLRRKGKIADDLIPRRRLPISRTQVSVSAPESPLFL
jgi:hypothetical protein